MDKHQFDIQAINRALAACNNASMAHQMATLLSWIDRDIAEQLAASGRAASARCQQCGGAMRGYDVLEDVCSACRTHAMEAAAMENGKRCAWCGKPVEGLEAAWPGTTVCDACWERHAAPRRARSLARKAPAR